MSQDPLQLRREFLKDTIRQEVDFSQTEQSRGLAPGQVNNLLALSNRFLHGSSFYQAGHRSIKKPCREIPAGFLANAVCNYLNL